MSKLTATITSLPRNDYGQFIEQQLVPMMFDRVDQAGALVVTEARRLAPVRSGALRDSISHRVDRVGLRIIATIYVGVHYGGYVEWGTGIRGSADGGSPYGYSASWPGMMAQPFLRPAQELMRGQVKGVISAAPLLAV